MAAGDNIDLDPELEELYMPSKWVVRVPTEQAVPLHVQVTTDESRRVRAEMSDRRLGVRYGPGPGDTVDMFGEEGSSSGSLMVYVSGGYWQELTGDISAYTVGPLVRAGHSVGVAHYTRAPAQDLAGMLRQLERLGAWLVEYAVTRRVRVTLAGHSAGSHLCALLLSSPWFRALTPAQAATFTGVVHLSGVFNLRPLLRTSINIPALQLRPDTVARWSPLAETNLAAVARVPALVVVGEHDSPAFRQQAEQYRDQLRARGVPVTFTTQGGEDHFSLVEKLKNDDYALSKQIIEFMNKY